MKTHSFLLLLILSIVFGTTSRADSNQSDPVYEAIIIPGYPYDADGKMNAIYKMRLFWAFHLYSEGRVEKIITSGSAVHSPYVEAEIFALYLMEMGVDADDIIIENQAQHSLENVFYGMEIARSRGFEKVAVATDMWQSGMIQFIANRYGHELGDVDFLPARIGLIVTRYWNSFDLKIDAERAQVTDFVPLVERKPKKERLQGTRGLLWTPSVEVTDRTALSLR